ncbi:hypothetical protein KI387_007214, partial [Taxus chinensis]
MLHIPISVWRGLMMPWPSLSNYWILQPIHFSNLEPMPLVHSLKMPNMYVESATTNDGDLPNSRLSWSEHCMSRLGVGKYYGEKNPRFEKILDGHIRFDYVKIQSLLQLTTVSTRFLSCL